MKTISKLIFTAVLSFSALSFQAKAEDFPEAIKPLMQKYTCFACHKVDTRLVGPAYQDVAAKYENTDDNVEMLAGKIIKGGSGNWGAIPMTAHANLSQEDAEAMVKYILLLKK